MSDDLDLTEIPDSTYNPKSRVQLKITYQHKDLKNLTKQQIKEVIHVILQKSINLLQDDMHKWINSKVPKRTGQLRESLIGAIDSSFVSRGRTAKIYLGSDVKYVKYLEKMTTSNVRHDGEVGYSYGRKGIHGRVILQDPQAIAPFFDKMVKYAKRRLMYHFRIQMQWFRDKSSWQALIAKLKHSLKVKEDEYITS